MLEIMTPDGLFIVSFTERIDEETIDQSRLIFGDAAERGVLDKSTNLIVMHSASFDEFMEYWYYVAGSSFDYQLKLKAVSSKNWSNDRLALSIAIDEEWQYWKLIELCERAGMTEEWSTAWRNGESEYEKVAYAAAEKLGVSIERKDYLI